MICHSNGCRVYWPREPGRWGWIVPRVGEAARFRPAIPLEVSGRVPDAVVRDLERVVHAARGTFG